jgi:hypothetical protein
VAPARGRRVARGVIQPISVALRCSVPPCDPVPSVPSVLSGSHFGRGALTP